MPSPLSTNRAYTKSRRQPQTWRSSVGPIFVLLAGSAISFWQVHVTWNELVSVQYSRKSSQALLTEKEGTLASEAERIKALLDELASVRSEVEERKQELLTTQDEIQAFKEQCEYKRTKLKEQQQQEIDDVTWEERAKAWKKLQELKDESQRTQEDGDRFLSGIREEHEDLEHTQAMLHKALSKVEMDRLLYRMLGNTTDRYVGAYFDRLRRGAYKDDFSVNHEYLAKNQARSHQAPNTPEGLWYVDDEGNRQPLNVMMSDIMEAVPQKDYFGPQYPRGGSFRTCAVVGNSGILLRYKFGEAIDKHDAVFRLNEAPTKGYEEYVGRKTTIRVVEDERHLEARAQPSKQLVLQVVKSEKTLESYLEYKSRPQSMNLHYLTPDFELHLSRYLLRPTPHGFLSVALAAQKCRKLTIYGFASNHRGHVQYQYFDKKEPALRLRSAVGSAFDTQSFAVGMLAELAQRSNGTIQFAQPCASVYQCFGRCQNCSEVPLSIGGDCTCDNPIPIPAAGYCAPPPSANIVHNCFHKCPKGVAQCLGGSAQKTCDKLGVDYSEKNPCV
mmetsp:Transcript_16654/g.20033  ORF Transcript_16654/g.20033 Transcript_16654/m.20033 type:complete len:557 (-) Transcript_16654:274-1944(-)|eukprot:CAMPEP_0197846278 /NCGR_PEP_ID=MMETSP1438-20131217/3044_1 /TAXON_ID=1461541 /ORGANISM="Pterosperma sp., Strain CCMP1384" /LENGTH=556 /DNA_ID=CAMNT_0043457859 /DNA_START=297 /DNA_END=1967 /DNA_ORIENTATION=+